MRTRRLTAIAGVTLTELLVVLLIISILSTIAMPVYINYAEQGKVAAAKEECYMLANAEEACAVHHGFYVPLQMLDDVRGRSGSPDLGNILNADAIGDYAQNVFAIDFNLPLDRLNAQPTIQLNSTDPRIRALISTWQGPFLSFQRFYDTDNNPTNQNKEDFPLDPWHNPYRFYAPTGDIIGSSRIAVTYTTSDFNGFIQPPATGLYTRVNRWAIVSWGPDGKQDVAGVVQDDVVYEFGMIVETSFSFLQR